MFQMVEAIKWMMAYMQGKTPQLDNDGWMWMLHGDVGEDNSKAGILNEKDSTPGQWIIFWSTFNACQRTHLVWTI